MQYQEADKEVGMVSEPVAMDYPIGKSSQVSRAITGDELLNRLRPRIEGLFK